MAYKGFKRKLAAILSTDVEGYSRLMAEDEAATVKTIASYREIMASLIKQHRGRVVDSPGDNLNGEYEKAIEILQKVIKRNPDAGLSNFELAACFGLLGREEEARAAAAEVLRIRPNFTIEMLSGHSYGDKTNKERTIAVLHKAGLKLN